MQWHPLKDAFKSPDGLPLTISVRVAAGYTLPPGFIYDQERGLGADEKVLKAGQAFWLMAIATELDGEGNEVGVPAWTCFHVFVVAKPWWRQLLVWIRDNFFSHK